MSLSSAIADDRDMGIFQTSEDQYGGTLGLFNDHCRGFWM